MPKFSKMFKKEKKDAKEGLARETECMTAIQAVLKTYNCVLRPVLKGDFSSIHADVELIALPPTKDLPITTTPDAKDPNQEAAAQA